MPTEGFRHKGRIVYSIRYALEAPPPTRAEIVVPLDCDRALVTVNPGEFRSYRGERPKVLVVDVYRTTRQV